MAGTVELIEKSKQYGAHNYEPLPVVLQKGKGAWVWDVEGKKYLDFLSCYSALNFGHQNPVLVSALTEQLNRLAVCSRAFYAEELALFLEELAQFCGMEMSLLMNSGTEAVETAIKIARKWGYEKKKVARDQAKILVAGNNFHGRSVTIVSFSSESGYREGYGPFTPGFEILPFGDLAQMEKAVDTNTIAVLLEPIQAEAGILIPPVGYLKSLRRLCDQHGLLLMLDEIQTGFGRTGKDFCFQHDGIKPDLLILGKSLGGGLLPLSAVVGERKVLEVIRPGQHGSTFGGNPLACAVGRAVLKLMRSEKISERSAEIGEEAIKALKKVASPKIKEVRARGALIGIDIDRKAGLARNYCEALAKKGVLCKETHETVIRIAPPLIIEKEDLKWGIEKINEVLQ